MFRFSFRIYHIFLLFNPSAATFQVPLSLAIMLFWTFKPELLKWLTEIISRMPLAIMKCCLLDLSLIFGQWLWLISLHPVVVVVIISNIFLHANMISVRGHLSFSRVVHMCKWFIYICKWDVLLVLFSENSPMDYVLIFAKESLSMTHQFQYVLWHTPGKIIPNDRIILLSHFLILLCKFINLLVPPQ